MRAYARRCVNSMHPCGVSVGARAAVRTYACVQYAPVWRAFRGAYFSKLLLMTDVTFDRPRGAQLPDLTVGCLKLATLPKDLCETEPRVLTLFRMVRNLVV